MKKENENDVVRLKQLNANQFNTIRELKEKNSALIASGEEMVNEITHLKRVIAGQKGKLVQFSNDLAKWLEYAREADELNEQKANRILELEKQLDAAIKDVEVAHDANSTANEQIASVCQANKELTDDIFTFKTNIEWYNGLPWYRKIFVTKI